MKIHDLQKRYNVLNNAELFETNREVGLSLPLEIIEDEVAFGFEEDGLNLSDYLVPAVIKEVCCLHNGFSVRWRYLREVEKGYPVMGFINYTDAYGIVNRSIVHEGMRLFLFDDFLDMWKVYIQLTDKEQCHKLYYFNLYENKMYPMCIGAEAYIDKAALCRGLTNWHEFFFEQRDYESEEGNRKRFRKEITTVFRDVAFDEFIRV
jgi:hypothetical protein